MLTLAQLQALKADIAADPALASQPMNADGSFAIAELYNQPASPAFRVWRTNIPVSDLKQAAVWTEFIARSAGERDAWQFMLAGGSAQSGSSINAADPNIRQGIQDIFSGPGGVGSRANLTAIAKRDATRAERLFATGTGSEAVPATMTFEGSLSYQDVEAARSLP
jgi:hypothetical protein